MIEMVRRGLPSPATGQDIERLHLHLNTVAQMIRDRGVSERGLSLLIDTTHDLSSYLGAAGSPADDRQPCPKPRRRQRRLADNAR